MTCPIRARHARRPFIHARLVTIPNCGHYPTQEYPPYFAMVIEDFLQDAAARA